MDFKQAIQKPRNVRLILGRMVPIGSFLEPRKMQPCPFHADSTPSAKLHDEDEDGIERLFCYACFPGDVRVSTDRGEIEIESLVEDYRKGVEVRVETPRGLRKVSFAGETGKRRVDRVFFEDGSFLDGSFDHPVVVLRGGKLSLVGLGDLRSGDRVLDREDSLLVGDSELSKLGDEAIE